MQLVGTRRDETTLLASKGTPDAKSDPKAVVVAGQVWEFYAASKEYVIPPFLGPDLRSVHHGRRNGDPNTCLPSAAEAKGLHGQESPNAADKYSSDY